MNGEKSIILSWSFLVIVIAMNCKEYGIINMIIKICQCFALNILSIILVSVYLLHFGFSACGTTFDGMVSCGITRRFPISLHLLFLRATNHRNPLKPACTIPCVVLSCLFKFLFKVNIFNPIRFVIVHVISYIKIRIVKIKGQACSVNISI